MRFISLSNAFVLCLYEIQEVWAYVVYQLGPVWFKSGREPGPLGIPGGLGPLGSLGAWVHWDS